MTLLASALLLLLPVAGRAAGDAEAGKTAFNRRCAVCHSVAEGQNKVGPSLHGVVGRASGSVAGFNYSPAMKSAGKTWDEASIDTYLQDPKAYVPGNRMILAGIKDEAERQNIIAYLDTQK
ncbi:c-type cytochrome [Paracraurococcus lichenis]|uniref:Cytochrome c family protein n=1 Tax=Paracraurococcus lichenis TaxID=3064888 RepID=A0ABT9E5H5_9PROT|nr:cytochrome c family protein [Paracraurococcus sp. LOR1-02]MDO9711426.1 cytochrome c family protein [Paracraurococcus sp. LOR1-02]